MSSYQIAREAQEDLREIQRYTQESWGITQSNKYLSGLFSLFSLLASDPEMGRAVSFREDLFRFPHQSHAAYFLKKSEGILFVAIMHKSQLPSDNHALFLHEPEMAYFFAEK